MISLIGGAFKQSLLLKDGTHNRIERTLLKENSLLEKDGQRESSYLGEQCKSKTNCFIETKIQRTVVLLVCSTLDTIQSRRFLLLTARQFSFKLLLKGIRNLHWGNDKVALVGDSRIKTQIIQNPITQTPIAMKDIRQAIILSTLNIRVVVYQQ